MGESCSTSAVLLISSAISFSKSLMTPLAWFSVVLHFNHLNEFSSLHRPYQISEDLHTGCCSISPSAASLLSSTDCLICRILKCLSLIICRSLEPFFLVCLQCFRFLFQKSSKMSPVVCFSAEPTHTHISLAEKLQRSLVVVTHPAFPVKSASTSQACDSLMRVQVTPIVGGQTGQNWIKKPPDLLLIIKCLTSSSSQTQS